MRIEPDKAALNLALAMDPLSGIISALESEDSVILATIIATSGSTPASAFSKMVVKRKGTAWLGTVGGGCLEGDVLETAKRLYGTNRAEILRFHLNENDMVQGLICGGSLDVMIEPIVKTQTYLIRKMRIFRDQGEDAIVATLISQSGSVVAKHVFQVSQDGSNVLPAWEKILRAPNSPYGRTSTDELVEMTLKSHHRHETIRMSLGDAELVLEPQSGQPQLIIFGGGHVSKSICRCASMAGFGVTVVDDRKEYATHERFPDAVKTLAVEFYNTFNHLRIKPSTYIVIVTRGHRSDEEILEQALKLSPKYIGMIGSKRKVLTTYEHLVERGVNINELKRVHAPMGVEIGAVTTEEIAISVVAELIHVRRGGSPVHHKSDGMTELLESLRLKK